MKSRLAFALVLLGCASTPRSRAPTPELTAARDALARFLRQPEDTRRRG